MIFISRNSTHSHNEDRGKIPSCLQEEERKCYHFEIHQSIVFLYKSALRRKKKKKTTCQNLSDLRERKHPTLPFRLGKEKYPIQAISSHTFPPELRRDILRSTSEVQRTSTQAHQKTTQLLTDPSHSLHLTTALQECYLPQFVNTVHHVHLLARNYKAY